MNVATVSALAAFKSIGTDAGETSHPCGKASFSSPFTGPVAAVTCTEMGFGLACREDKHAVRELRENGWCNDQRPSHFARHRIDGAIFRVQQITQFLSVHLQNYFDRNSGRILRKTNQLLIVHMECARAPCLRSQYGCEYGVLSGILQDRSFVTSSFTGSAASIFIESPVLGNRTSLQCDRYIRAGDCLELYCCRLPWREGFICRRRFNMQAETCGDDLVQLCFFLRHPGVITDFLSSPAAISISQIPTRLDRRD